MHVIVIQLATALSFESCSSIGKILVWCISIFRKKSDNLLIYNALRNTVSAIFSSLKNEPDTVMSRRIEKYLPKRYDGIWSHESSHTNKKFLVAVIPCRKIQETRIIHIEPDYANDEWKNSLSTYIKKPGIFS